MKEKGKMEKKTIVALTIAIIVTATIVAVLSQSFGGTSEGTKIYVDPPMVIEEAR